MLVCLSYGGLQLWTFQLWIVNMDVNMDVNINRDESLQQNHHCDTSRSFSTFSSSFVWGSVDFLDFLELEWVGFGVNGLNWLNGLNGLN